MAALHFEIDIWEIILDTFVTLACGLRRGNSALHTSNVPKKLVLHVTVACSLNGAVESAL